MTNEKEKEKERLNKRHEIDKTRKKINRDEELEKERERRELSSFIKKKIITSGGGVRLPQSEWYLLLLLLLFPLFPSLPFPSVPTDPSDFWTAIIPTVVPCAVLATVKRSLVINLDPSSFYESYLSFSLIVDTLIGIPWNLYLYVSYVSCLPQLLRITLGLILGTRALIVIYVTWKES